MMYQSSDPESQYPPMSDGSYLPMRGIYDTQPGFPTLLTQDSFPASGCQTPPLMDYGHYGNFGLQSTPFSPRVAKQVVPYSNTDTTEWKPDDVRLWWNYSSTGQQKEVGPPGEMERGYWEWYKDTSERIERHKLFHYFDLFVYAVWWICEMWCAKAESFSVFMIGLVVLVPSGYFILKYMLPWWIGNQIDPSGTFLPSTEYRVMFGLSESIYPLGNESEDELQKMLDDLNKRNQQDLKMLASYEVTLWNFGIVMDFVQILTTTYITFFFQIEEGGCVPKWVFFFNILCSIIDLFAIKGEAYAMKVMKRTITASGEGAVAMFPQTQGVNSQPNPAQN